MKLYLLILLGVGILFFAIVEGITTFLSDLLGVHVMFEIGCLVFFLILIIIAIPWIVFKMKYDKMKKIKKVESFEYRNFCSRCGKDLTLTKYGKFCESCKKYD